MRAVGEKLYLNASLFFAALAAALLAGMVYTTSDKLSPILAILSGMATMGAMTSFQRYLDTSHKAPVLAISFNEDFLGTAIESTYHKLISREKKDLEFQALPWSLSSEQFLGVDNALALAKLRMDIESEIRRIAHESSLPIPHKVGISIRNLATELVSADVLPASLLEPLTEVSSVCNRGIHGEDVPNELAASVLKIGNQLLEGLRLLPAK